MSYQFAIGKEGPFLNEPDAQPYYVTEGAKNVVLPCSFSESFQSKESYEPNWLRTANGTPDYITRGDLVYESNGDYELLTDTPGQYNLKIKNVEYQRDNGKFFCKLLSMKDRKQFSSAPAQIVVLLPPGDASIINQPDRPVKENDLVSFQCEVHGGNPLPEMSWTYGNGSEMPSKWYRTVSNQDGHVSTLQFLAAPDHHKAFPVCRVTNKAMAGGDYKSANGKPLDVLHAPIVTIEPSSLYNVEEGKNVIVTCLAEGNPMPTYYEWRNLATGEHFTGGKIWSFVGEREHSGELQCTSKNSIGYGTKTALLNVQYGPIVTVKHFVNPSEGDEIHLDCIVDSNPPSTRIIWTGPNNFLEEGSKLFIKKISSEQTGNYTCTATNTLTTSKSAFGSGETMSRQGLGTTLIEVKRKPGPAVVITTTTSYPVGSTFVLSCLSSDIGSPNATYKWATPRTGGLYTEDPSYKEQSLKVEKAKLTDNGVYKCLGYNSLGEGEEGRVKMTVVLPSKITKPLPITRHLVTGDVDIVFECEAIGYPAPSIGWFLNGNGINTDDELKHYWKVNTRLVKRDSADCTFCSSIVVSSLSLNHVISWTDKGNYSCVASNAPTDLSKPATSSALITVQHAAVVLNDKYPEYGLAAADMGESASINCLVSSRPEPRFIWYKNNEELKDGVSSKKYIIKSAQLIDKIDEYQSILTILNVNKEDYGMYSCKSNNGRNTGEQISYDVILSARSKPQAPQNLRIFTIGPNSLRIGWIPSFDGGLDQEFEVQYTRIDPRTNSPASESQILKLNKDMLTLVPLYEVKDSALVRSRAKRSNEGGSSKNIHMVTYYTFNVTKLLPLSSYYCSVRASNSLGSSDWSSPQKATTEDVKKHTLDLKVHSMKYNPEEKSLEYEMPPISSPNNYCVMVYMNNDAHLNISDPHVHDQTNWQTINCYSMAEPIKDIPAARHFRSRICMKDNYSMCSPVSHVLSDTHTRPWEMLLVFGVGAFTLVCFIICIFGCLCRNRKQKSNCAKNGAKVSKKNSNKSNINPTESSISSEEAFSKMQFANSIEPSFTPLSRTPEQKVFALDADEMQKRYDSFQQNDTRGLVMLPSPSTFLESEYHRGYAKLVEDIQTGQMKSTCPSRQQTESTDSVPSNLNEYSPTASTTDDIDNASYSTNGGSRRVMREIIV
uniref:B-cell receptor CD22 n=1 Tax=Rhabditophanes sp. KR3021 TaxID=114890 RepID=A0AC35TZ51_9BILA